MDSIDLQIIEELKENSRKSFNEISARIGKTEATVRRRVHRLIRQNIIRQFTIKYQVDPKPKIHATIKIEPDFKNIKRILKDLRTIKEVTDIWRLSGDCGLLIKVEIPSIDQFNPLIEEKISQVGGLKIIETCFITDVIKGE